jgi:hypothetical protein
MYVMDVCVCACVGHGAAPVHAARGTQMFFDQLFVVAHSILTSALLIDELPIHEMPSVQLNLFLESKRNIP